MIGMWCVKVRRAVMEWSDWMGKSWELEVANVWKVILPFMRAYFQLPRLFPQLPGPIMQSVKSPKALGSGLFSWSLSCDPKWPQQLGVDPGKPFTPPPLGRLLEPDKRPSAALFQASLQALIPSTSLNSFSVLLSGFQAPAVYPHSASQPGSLYVALRTDSLYSSWATSALDSICPEIFGIHILCLPHEPPSSQNSCPQSCLPKPTLSTSLIFTLLTWLGRSLIRL